MSDTGLNRRQFLQTSGLAAAGAVIASGTVLMASDGAWALQLSTLTADEGMAILQMSRQLYPHDSLGDIYYAGVVEALDAGAKSDSGLVGLLKDGVAELDGAKGLKFVELSDGNQLEVLTALESSGFFQKVRGTTVVSLYNNPLVWRHFGYEGSSHEYGGYLKRGFGDLKWAGEPSEDASPKAG